ncbi:MAG: hypothetical protein H7242_02735, partial [Microbacteriaceae bacterium]|nr:hypothetical protein [Burkholderiaceae bacterium]
HGRITEQGRHEDLTALVQADGHLGWYAAQWRVQQIEVSLLDGDGDGDGGGGGGGAGDGASDGAGAGAGAGVGVANRAGAAAP